VIVLDGIVVVSFVDVETKGEAEEAECV